MVPPSLDLLMKSISDLEQDLELLESGAPVFLSTMREQLIPYLQRMALLYRELIEWLGAEAALLKKGKGMRAEMNALACFLCDRAVVLFGVNLSSVLYSAGFAPPQAAVEADWPEVDFEPSPSRRKILRRDSLKETRHADAFRKKLYYGLARDLHPDKAEVSQRAERTELMQRLNAAYQRCDMRALLDLLHGYGSIQMKADLNAPTFEMLDSILRKQQMQTQDSLTQKLASLPSLDVSWVHLLRDESCAAQLLRRERRRAEQDCERLDAVFKELRKPKNLSRFFRDYPEECWGAIF